MKPKLTFYKLIDFISKSKINSKLLTLFLILITSFSYSQTCNANLEVIKNRNIRSTTSEGTYYKMSITNNSLSLDEYSLNSLNINNICTNNDGSSSATNVGLITSFEDNNFNTITKITIQPGETFSFLAHITVPPGTPIDKWCCTQVTAISNICKGYKVNITLHTLVINSNDD